MRDAELHMLRVVGVGGGDVDQLHTGVAEHLSIAAVGFFEAILGGEGFGPVQIPGGHGVEVHILHPLHGIGHGVGDLACADKSDVHGGSSVFVFSVAQSSLVINRAIIYNGIKSILEVSLWL